MLKFNQGEWTISEALRMFIRKLHEKGLLTKVTNAEERLNSYLNNLSNAVDEVRAGNENVKLPSLDLDAVKKIFNTNNTRRNLAASRSGGYLRR